MSSMNNLNRNMAMMPPLAPMSREQVLEHQPDCVPPPLKLDDRVIWLSDSGPEYGHVRWIGKIFDSPDLCNGWTIGVEFENPVGTGKGSYNGYKLFSTPLNHASLMIADGLIKQENFIPKVSNKSLPRSLEKKSIESTNSSGSKKHQSNSKTLPRQTKSSNTVNKPKKISKSDFSLSNVFNVSNKYIFEKNQTVELNFKDEVLHGVYLGCVIEDGVTLAEVELSDPNDKIEGIIEAFGISENKKFKYNCILWPIHQLRLDSRFADSYEGTSISSLSNQDEELHVKLRDLRVSDKIASANSFCMPCHPPVIGNQPPLAVNAEELAAIAGKGKGIQGNHNSCYMDAMLFAMFAFNFTFESLLLRRQTKKDINQYNEVQMVLKEHIVNPLRKYFFVGSESVMQLRRLLDRLSTMSGLTCEEKDPEEFINLLLGKILTMQPFLKLSSGHDSFLYQLIVDKDESISYPSVQQLFDQSFANLGIKLCEIPSCLILQLPRYGKQFKLYDQIDPSTELDISNVLKASKPTCIICNDLATFKCLDCTLLQPPVLLCGRCSKKLHLAKNRQNHQLVHLDVSQESFLSNDCVPPRVKMELFAVLCIETSHYVCFAKCAPGKNAPWCFFDSMADRQGEENGFNIPEVLPFKNIETLKEHYLFRRLLSDAYMCLYRSSEMEIYR